MDDVRQKMMNRKPMNEVYMTEYTAQEGRTKTMHLTVEMARKDDVTFSYRDVMKELKCCGFDVPHRTEITNEDIRFFAWLCRSAVALIEKKDAEIERMEEEQHKDAEEFADAIKRIEEEMEDSTLKGDLDIVKGLRTAIYIMRGD